MGYRYFNLYRMWTSRPKLDGRTCRLMSINQSGNCPVASEQALIFLKWHHVVRQCTVLTSFFYNNTRLSIIYHSLRKGSSRAGCCREVSSTGESERFGISLLKDYRGSQRLTPSIMFWYTIMIQVYTLKGVQFYKELEENKIVRKFEYHWNLYLLEWFNFKIFHGVGFQEPSPLQTFLKRQWGKNIHIITDK